MKSLATWLVVAMFVALQLCVSVYGQSVSGSITGEIVDSSGAALGVATVDVVNIATGAHHTTKTNDSGYFNVLNLIAGAYRVDVTAAGFRPVAHEGVQVNIGSVLRLDFKLELGNVQEKITVIGESPLLETAKVEVGSTVTTKALNSLPVEGRNPTALAALQAGVVMSTNGQGIPSAKNSANYTFSVNGQRSQQNRQLLDGVDDTEGVGGAAPIVPSLMPFKSTAWSPPITTSSWGRSPEQYRISLQNRGAMSFTEAPMSSTGRTPSSHAIRSQSRTVPAILSGINSAAHWAAPSRKTKSSCLAISTVYECAPRQIYSQRYRRQPFEPAISAVRRLPTPSTTRRPAAPAESAERCSPEISSPRTGSILSCRACLPNYRRPPRPGRTTTFSRPKSTRSSRI